MLKPVKAEELHLEQPPFVREEVRFNLLHRIRETPGALLLTDGDRVIVGQSIPGLAWVYTASGAGPEVLEPLKQSFTQVFYGRALRQVTARRGVAQPLAQALAAREGISCHKHETLQAYVCKRVLPLPQPAGGPCRAQPEDAAVIAQCVKGFALDATHVGMTEEAVLAQVEADLANKDFYVWRDGRGEVAATAAIAHRAPRHGRIHQVYTRPPLRNRGIGAALVARLCQMLLEEGLTPMLYADAAYPPANQAYRKVGFTPVGTLDVMQLDR